MQKRTAPMESFWTRCLPAPVNRKLLPLKAHFFLYLAGHACVFPYLAVIGRQNGIDASTIAVILSLTPLTAVIIKPVCGFFIDRTQNATAVIVFLQVVLVISHGVVFFSPSIKAHTYSSFVGYLNCNSSRLVMSNSSSASCVVSRAHESSPVSCNLTVFEDGLSGDVNVTGASDSMVSINGMSGICSKGSVCGNVANETYAVLHCPCQASLYNGKFWIYTISVVISWAFSGALYTVTDAAVCEMLGDNVNAFGRQRLWGTISWGIVSPLSGLLIDNASDSSYADYKPGFYLFTVIMFLDILLLLSMPRLRTADLSLNLFKDVATLFCNAEFVLFTLWTFIVGALIGVIWSFSTWYLEDLRASKLMIGLTSTVMSLCVEVPLFFVSKTILERIGYFFSYSAAFLTLSIKFIGYSYLVNPWYGLIVDIPGGAIFPLVFSSMTVFAKQAAPPGTTASVMCILASTLEGLGIATGNMLGGMSIDKIGARFTFRYLGYTSAGCAVLCTLTYLCLLLLGCGRFGGHPKGTAPQSEKFCPTGAKDHKPMTKGTAPLCDRATYSECVEDTHL